MLKRKVYFINDFGKKNLFCFKNTNKLGRVINVENLKVEMQTVALCWHIWVRSQRSKRKLSLYVDTFLRVVINVDKNSGELFFGNLSLSYQPNLT